MSPATITRRAMPAVLLLGLAGPASAQPGGHHHGAPAGGTPRHDMQAMMDATNPAPGDAPSTRDFKAADRAMMHAMHVPYTGDPDVDFRTHMIPHHQGAIDMAKVVLRHTSDPATRRMAQAIIAEQEREIAEMRDWLKAKGR
ncbi:CopM family metallochaperone [Methylobacterium oryzisoli]|uniref:CopM family metallochaperone n=1 Tax=Methylobacterium oryzisoli TaxID=3385502 RepID=UPI0038912A74